MGRNYKGIGINTTSNTHETVFELIKEKKDKTVVDIPSGGGAFVLRLRDHGFTNIMAADIENILEIAHDNFIQADMTERFPLADGAADIVVCIDGIEHISRQFDFVREVYRVLSPGGEIIISTPNISSIRSRRKWFWTGHHHKCNAPLDENNPTPLHHIAMISFAEMRYLLHTSGFTVTEIKTNRIKPVSLVYAIFLPLIYLATLWVYLREGKRDNTVKMNLKILKQVFSIPVLFGETIIVKGVKTV